MTVPAMLDIAYLALMSACLVGCVTLVGWLSRREESPFSTETNEAAR